MSASASGVAEPGTILGVWAHPDDEAYLSGGRLISTISPMRAGSREVAVPTRRNPGVHVLLKPVQGVLLALLRRAGRAVIPGSFPDHRGQGAP